MFPGGKKEAGLAVRPFLVCASSMGAILEVEVPPQIDHDEPSDPLPLGNRFQARSSLLLRTSVSAEVLGNLGDIN